MDHGVTKSSIQLRITKLKSRALPVIFRDSINDLWTVIAIYLEDANHLRISQPVFRI